MQIGLKSNRVQNSGFLGVRSSVLRKQRSRFVFRGMIICLDIELNFILCDFWNLFLKSITLVKRCELGAVIEISTWG